MKLIRKQYHCSNNTGCYFALNDKLFSEAEYREYNGKCPGEGKGGANCGNKLEEATTTNYWPHASLLLVTLVVISYFVLQLFMPVKGVIFKTKRTIVNESDGIVVVLVRLKESIEEPLTVYYKTYDSTAKANLDYEAIDGKLLFDKNETEQSVEIDIYQDDKYKEGKESFTLQLTNVSGKPEHRVIIEDSAFESQVVKEADALVRALSVVAKDVANLYVEIEVLANVLSVLSEKNSERNLAKVDSTKQSLLRTRNRFTLARERYLELFKDISLVDAAAVDASFENWLNRLQLDDGNKQQFKVTKIILEQLTEYRKTKMLRMNRWAMQLSESIPRVDQNNLRNIPTQTM